MVTKTIKSYVYKVVYIDSVKDVLETEVTTSITRPTYQQVKEMARLAEGCRVLAVSRIRESTGIKYGMTEDEFMKHAQIIE